MKFKIGDKVVCNKKDLSDSKTDYHCGLERQMVFAARDSYVMTVNSIMGDHNKTVRLEHENFDGSGWWFHPEDLKHHNLILENK